MAPEAVDGADTVEVRATCPASAGLFGERKAWRETSRAGIRHAPDRKLLDVLHLLAPSATKTLIYHAIQIDR